MAFEIHLSIQILVVNVSQSKIVVRSAYRMLIEKASQEEEHSDDKSSHSDVKNKWV
jgi:hypothetical protein